MLNVLTSFMPSFKILFKDKVNFLFTSLPILIGILIYWFLGKSVYDFAMTKGRSLIDGYIENSSIGMFSSYFFQIVLYIILFFIINWTFVLVVSIIASPFNDLISARVEKKLTDGTLPTIGESFKTLFGTVLFTVFNEIKKISFIILLTIIALLLNLIPFFTPISLLLTVLLIAASYVDYSWGRHNIKFRSCITDVIKNMISYGIGGVFFFFLISVPVINLIVPSWATSFFTMIWVKNNEHRYKAS